MAMEVESASNFDWANDAFVALNHPNAAATSDKWTTFNQSQASSFGIPPSLLTQSTVERYGQVTPPEELSPADHSVCFRQQSPPVERLRNEVSWPVDTQMQALANYHPSPVQASDQEQSPQHSHPSPKRRRTTRAASANQNQAVPVNPARNAPEASPQPVKRKRGRPKSQPQPSVEAYDPDGFPFQVSSARQTHLEKNRVAAHKCRQRKKEYINSLETRAREFSSRNKQLKENVALLREEVLELKNEVLRHAGCGFWAVDEYLARCAGDLLGIDGRGRTMGFTKSLSQCNNGNTASSPSLSTVTETRELASITPDAKIDREARHESITSQDMIDTPEEWGGLELLKDIDEDMVDEAA